MREILLGLSILLFAANAYSQHETWQEYESNVSHPFGLANPNANPALKDFEPMIGTCDCKSLSRNPDGSWQDTVSMIWTFKYAMNGTAIQDLVWRENSYASSLRQYNSDSALWIVSYHSYPVRVTTIPTWKGKKVGNNIVLKMPQRAPNGMEGISRLTFSDISENGFNWKGEWVKEDSDFIYPTWYIWCIKRNK